MPHSRQTAHQPRRHHRSVDRDIALAAGVAGGIVLAALVVGGIAVAIITSAAQESGTSNAGAVRTSLPKTSAAKKAAPTPVSRPKSSSAAVAPPASANGTLSVSAVGDMAFGRSTGRVVARKGGAAPLANVAPLLAQADVAIGNLEGAVSATGTEAKWKDVRLRGDPRAVQGLQLAGFDALALANNHMFDYGWPAVSDTLATLSSARIGVSGAGADRVAAWKPVVVTRRGTNVAVLSFTRVLPNGFRAEKSHPGVASAYEEDLVVRAIRDAKKRYGRVIVQFHWGVEYADRPKSSQTDLAHHAVDAGADLVIGHHPHVIEGLESYRGKLIAYSLGDFVFEHYSARTGESFILSAEIGPHGTGEVLITPVYLDEQGVPSVVQGKVAQRILGRLKSLSAERGLQLEIEGDTGRVIAGARRS